MEKHYHISIESDIKIFDQDFFEEQKEKSLRRKIASPKAFSRKYGYTFFKNSKGYKANMDDVIANLDSMIDKGEKYIINLKK